MWQCHYCQVEVKGNWSQCPLCQNKLDSNQPVIPSSHPDIPLRFNRRSLTTWLINFSLIVVIVILALGLFFQGRFLLLQAALFGIITMWLSVLIIIRKRRNMAKSLLYLWTVLSLMSLYLDYLIGWTNWSITFAIPIISSSVLLSMLITSRLTRMKDVDYVLYWTAAELLSLMPLIFLFFGWVNYRLPSLISVGLGLFMLIFMLIKKGPVIWQELKKRTFI